MKLYEEYLNEAFETVKHLASVTSVIRYVRKHRSRCKSQFKEGTVQREKCYLAVAIKANELCKQKKMECDKASNPKKCKALWDREISANNSSIAQMKKKIQNMESVK